jgi:hypothetical protein
VLRRILPKVIKDTIRRSLQKHEMLNAKKLASTSKRIDICSAQFAHGFHLSSHPSLSGKVCLEIGSGWVLSHAIVCHLLGAKKVIATDAFPHAHPQVLYEAIHESVISIVRDILSPFEEHALIRSRLDNLLSIRHFDFNVLKGLGIEYIAPMDYANARLNLPVDFVFSNSALEHIPCEDVPFVLRNIIADLSARGTMIHYIHLEDHKDFSRDPFGFLSIPCAEYSSALQSSRGNRIRKSGWQGQFSGLEDSDTKFIYEWIRRDRELPAQIDPSIHYEDDLDLRISHIGVYTKKLH